MSVNHPLIKQLKGIVLKLYNESERNYGEITDKNIELLRFCEIIEQIFHNGYINNQERHYLIATIKRKLEIFEWLSTTEIFLKHPLFNECIEFVKNSKRTQTQLGRFRLLIRTCLVKKCLNQTIENLINSGQIENYYTKNSIIGDEILIKILSSVLMQCNKINFNLNLDNATFLDFTWNLPELIKLEILPCNSLGIGVSFAHNKAVIVNIEENSIIAENNRINRGDILESLNGVLLTSSCKGQLGTIFRLNKNRPIQITIIKAYNEETSTIYSPIKQLLKNLHIQLDEDKKITSNNNREVSFNRAGYQAVYLGCIDVGKRGDIRQIQNALKYFTTNKQFYNVDNFKIITKTEVDVIVEIGEMKLKVFNTTTNEIIMKHSYMQISSCGSIPQLPHHIAYISGDENCENSNKFICYIFYVRNLDGARGILQSIGQGFHRTHFMV